MDADLVRDLVSAPRGVHDLGIEVKIARIVHESRVGEAECAKGIEVGPIFGPKINDDQTAEDVSPYQQMVREVGNA